MMSSHLRNRPPADACWCSAGPDCQCRDPIAEALSTRPANSSSVPMYPNNALKGTMGLRVIMGTSRPGALFDDRLSHSWALAGPARSRVLVLGSVGLVADGVGSILLAFQKLGRPLVVISWISTLSPGWAGPQR